MNPVILSIAETSSFQHLVRLALEIEGFVIHEKQNYEAGIALAHELAPDLILLDLMLMSPSEGFKLCQTIIKNPTLGHIPVVMLASSGNEDEIESGLRAGAKGYLVKPFYPKELVALANRLLSEKQPGGP